MSIHGDIVSISLTGDISTVSPAKVQHVYSGQSPPYELPLLRKTHSTPASSFGSCQISDLGHKAKKFPFKINLPRGNQDDFLNSHVIADFEPLSRPNTIRHDEVITGAISKPVSDLSFPLSIWSRSQSPPPEDSLSGTSATFSEPLSKSTSMASKDSNNETEDADMGEDEQSDEIENVRLDLDDVSTSVVDRLAHAQLSAATLSLVHQPLPFQLPIRLLVPHPIITSLFTRILNRLRSDNRIKASHIRIEHVLSPNTLPEVIPSSPPVTPSSLIRSSDQHGYFAVKAIFSSVSTSTGVALPPGDAHLCITERLIPPSGEFEISGFLNDTTDSGFMIRLNELAKGGIFVFVLPTSHGGQTFHKSVLSKILSPVLRSIIFRLGLHSELAKDISNLAALKQLLSFEAMQSKIQAILSVANTASFPGTIRPSFELVSATKGTVSLPFEAWYTWWQGQEKTRIMGLLNYHLNVHGQGLASSSTSESYNRSSIMLELDAQMRQAGSQQTVVPDLEVAVFTVQRVDA